jgi:hypothetical protein
MGKGGTIGLGCRRLEFLFVLCPRLLFMIEFLVSILGNYLR